jgi:DNA-binding winged helix-turn-helix (wHTH) protein
MSGKKLRFAEFELDVDKFQLYRHGELVRLEGLPLHLLIFLAQHPCQLVTREEIAQALWGKDVFVDAETGINTAIRKIRRALDDDSAQPRYLQTVVGHGYRFVAEIVSPDSSSGGGVSFTADEFGQAVMAAAGLDPQNPKAPRKA